MEDLRTSITVSILALFVIFITLAILIGVIKILVAWMPYVDPPPSETKKKVTALNNDPEINKHVAIIHAALSNYIGKSPEEIQISEIRSV